MRLDSLSQMAQSEHNFALMTRPGKENEEHVRKMFFLKNYNNDNNNIKQREKL